MIKDGIQIYNMILKHIGISVTEKRPLPHMIRGQYDIVNIKLICTLFS